MAVNVQIEESWKEVLKEEFEKDYFHQLRNFLKSEKSNGSPIFPPGNRIFAAFELVPFSKVKAVILGQDPYHGKGQANGLCFSVNDGIDFPPSLQNIFKELNSDLQIPIPSSGNLEPWCQQGVFLLNAILTVRENSPGSHQKHGWEQFTDAVIRELSEKRNGLVFILWGKYAQQKLNLIDTHKHFVLTAPHPSPFSVHTGFYGCKHFSKTNNILIREGKQPINWSLN